MVPLTMGACARLTRRICKGLTDCAYQLGNAFTHFLVLQLRNRFFTLLRKYAKGGFNI